ncbi:MAG: hypothetical protein HYV09_08505 [Deltaproteobacteria bacterium]|nr:hypothetical protein [Deltaproteobacteria bacterium]
MTRALVTAVALGLLGGCQVEALEGAEYAGPRNRCEVGCPADATCRDGACVASQTTYPLLLEATPPSSARFAPGVTFSIAVDDRRGGSRDLALPETAHVVARLEAGASIPLVLRLERVGAVPGAPAVTFEAKSSSGSPITPPLTVPPGDYHVFVAPADDANLTQFPPVQLRAEDTREPLVVAFPPGSHELRIAYGGGLRKVDFFFTSDGKPLVDAAEARDVRVIDETTGRLASTIAHTCDTAGQPLKSMVTLVLAPEIAGHRYTLRVEPAAVSCSAATPPVRPTIDFDLAALDVEGRGNTATLPIPRMRTVLGSGFVQAFGKPEVIDGTIVLRSVKLDDAVEESSGHVFSVVTAKVRGGSFAVEVLPGTYRADVLPSAEIGRPSEKYAICVDCTVPSQDSSAKPGERTAEFRVDGRGVLDFQIARRVQVSGGAAGFDGALFTLGTWEASTSTSLAGYSLLGARLITRAQTGLVSVLKDRESGRTWNLAGALDPGSYDFIVRTHEASGYPWIVRPRLEVPAQAALDLGVMTATAPVVFSGVVLDPAGAPVPRATIRARALITESDPKKPALGAVLVGETRADAFGRYRLVVPSALTAPKKEPAGPT